MRSFLNLATRTKLFLGFGLMILFLAAVIGVAFTGITRIQESQNNLYQSEFKTAIDLTTIGRDENEVRAAILMMMSSTKRSEQEILHHDIKENSKSIDETLKRLFERGRSDAQLLHGLQELEGIRNDFNQTRDTETIPLIYEGKLEDAKKLGLGIQAERFRKIRSITEELGIHGGKA